MTAVVHVARGHFAAAVRLAWGGSEFFARQRRMDIADEWSQNGDTLDDDGTDDLGGVPDVRVRVAPEVPFVLGVAAVFPASADRGDDGDDHAKAHGQAESDFLNFAHIQVPSNQPGESGHDEVHYDIVHWLCQRGFHYTGISSPLPPSLKFSRNFQSR